jgi:hypothetical protein
MTTINLDDLIAVTGGAGRSPLKPLETPSAAFKPLTPLLAKPAPFRIKPAEPLRAPAPPYKSAGWWDIARQSDNAAFK